jgi:hypothetical protein
MSVILSDGLYTVRKRAHPYQRDDHGLPVPPELSDPLGPLPGCATEQQDGSWSLRLDPTAWPMREDDQITGPNGTVWMVRGQPVLYVNNANPALNYVSIQAVFEPLLEE